MKIASFTLVASLMMGGGRAFAPQLGGGRLPTELNLFGQGNKGGAANKGPGMMDQLAMFKKAQEVAQKKQTLDKELQAMDFKASAADDKVSATFKYVPVKNPMDPNPDYEMISLDFDDDYFEAATPEDLSKDIMEVYRAGIDVTNKAVMEKYQSLTADLGEVLGSAAQGMQGDAPAS